MATLAKANKRDKARFKRNNGMRVTGKSVFIIQSTLIKRGTKAKKKRAKNGG